MCLGRLRVHSKCLANCPDWNTVLTHVVYQLFRCCWPVGHPAKHFFNQWVIHESIQSLNPAASQAVGFIHAFSPLVSQRPNQPADWNCVDADTDVSARVGLSQAHSPPGAAGCQLTSWCFYPALAPCRHWLSLDEPQLKYLTLSLYLFELPKKNYTG